MNKDRSLHLAAAIKIGLQRGVVVGSLNAVEKVAVDYVIEHFEEVIAAELIEVDEKLSWYTRYVNKERGNG